jgi:type VI protein secretion system component Hcp
MKRFFFCSVIVILTLFLTTYLSFTSAHAGYDEPLLLVKWGDHPGDSTIAGYDNYSKATGIHMGISNDCDPLASGLPSCDAYFDELIIEKYASVIGVILAKNCGTGERLDEIKIVSLNSEKNPVPMWEIKLYHTTILKIASSRNSTDGRLMESIELSPQQIVWIFYSYGPDGGGQEMDCTTWNRMDNSNPFSDSCSFP